VPSARAESTRFRVPSSGLGKPQVMLFLHLASPIRPEPQQASSGCPLYMSMRRQNLIATSDLAKSDEPDEDPELLLFSADSESRRSSPYLTVRTIHAPLAS